MSVEKVKNYLKKFGLEGRVKEFDESSATVELAALAIGCEENRIAKTMAFDLKGEPILIVFAGDAKVDNHKFKEKFHTKATMIKPDELSEKVGHAMGGVCPFDIKDNVKTYLDESLKRFDTVYPAAGTSNSAVKLNIEELENACQNFTECVDVSKIP